MELIAASRIVRAHQRVEAARPYSEQITEVIRNLQAAGAGGDHPLLRAPEQVQRVGYVVITSDRGLAGGYNANVQRAAEHALRADIDAGRDYAVVAVGRKGLNYFRFREYRIHSSYQGMSDLPSYEDARQVAGEVMRLFEAGEVDMVKVAYTRFLSVGTQSPTVAQLMPLEARGTDTAGAGAGAPASGGADEMSAGRKQDYEFEPGPDAILERLLPRYVEARMFAHMLDASASEHAARQRAMKAATDNADELMKTLTRVADQARQSEITTEIMEIVGGAEALEPSGEAQGGGVSAGRRK